MVIIPEIESIQKEKFQIKVGMISPKTIKYFSCYKDDDFFKG